jgi:ribosome-binding factor A
MSPKKRRARSRFAKRDQSTLSPSDFPGEPPPDGAGHRQARLEHILIDELQSLISDEATDPSLDGVRVLAVHLSPDGGHARVAYAVVARLSLETEARHATRAGLTRATPFLRARLAHLQLKKLPKLTFTFVGVTSEGGAPCPA